jgi:predicted amidophosphoribosyltransferase
MKAKLHACPACGTQIYKGARTCPNCGKTRTSAVGIIIAVLIGLAAAWLLTARTCSESGQLDKAVEEAQRHHQRNR